MDWPWSTFTLKHQRELIECDVSYWQKAWGTVHLAAARMAGMELEERLRWGENSDLPGGTTLARLPPGFLQSVVGGMHCDLDDKTMSFTTSSVASLTYSPYSFSPEAILDGQFIHSSLLPLDIAWPRRHAWKPGKQGQGWERLRAMMGETAISSWLRSRKRLVCVSAQAEEQLMELLDGGIWWESLMVDCPQGDQYKHSLMIRLREGYSEAGWPPCVVYIEPGSWQDPHQAHQPGAHISLWWRLPWPEKESPTLIGHRAPNTWVCGMSDRITQDWMGFMATSYYESHPASGCLGRYIDQDDNTVGHLDPTALSAHTFDPTLPVASKAHWEMEQLTNKHGPTYLETGDDIGVPIFPPTEKREWFPWEWEHDARGVLLHSPRTYRFKTGVDTDQQAVGKANLFFNGLGFYPTLAAVMTSLGTLSAVLAEQKVILPSSRRRKGKKTIARRRRGGVQTRNLVLSPDQLAVITPVYRKGAEESRQKSKARAPYQGVMPLRKVSGYKQRKWILAENMQGADEVIADHHRVSTKGKSMIRVVRDVAGGYDGPGYVQGSEEIQPRHERLKTGVDDLDALTPTH
jgi:hypothetical protein